MNSSVFESSCGRTIISWKVYCIEDEKLNITLQGLKQHVSNHFLEDCKIGTSPEKMYSVDGFRNYTSVIMSNVQNKAFRRFSILVQFDSFSTLYKSLSVWAETLKA